MRLLTAAAIMILATEMCQARPIHSSTAESREAFLARVDAALAQRDAQAILALADVKSWVDSGRPAPDPSAVVLPPTPVSRVHALSDTDILYAERTGREWRLSLRGDAENGWRIMLRDRACPATGGMARGAEFQRPAQPEASGAWTPLECWPLPK